MSKQYNLVADQYDISFQVAPYRLHVEAYSTFQLLGDVNGQTVLDVATGTGFYARAMRQRGAAKVVAVDIAEQMVDIGRAAEANEPLGIEYHVADITAFKTDIVFDLVLAIYLLHYAPTKEILGTMCHTIAEQLKSGGRFITYQLNPDFARETDYYLAQPGMVVPPLQVHPVNGEPISFAAKIGEITMPEVTAYRWDKNSIENALTEAGFVNIRWIRPELSPEATAEFGYESFAQYLKQPHAVLIECFKA